VASIRERAGFLTNFSSGQLAFFLAFDEVSGGFIPEFAVDPQTRAYFPCFYCEPFDCLEEKQATFLSS
jgi:hypothetical protein